MDSAPRGEERLKIPATLSAVAVAKVAEMSVTAAG